MPDRVRIEGVPPIPMSLVDAVAPYGQFRQARFLAWHPAERRMLIATAFGDVIQVHEVRGPGGARTQLTFHRDGVTGGAWYDPAGRYTIFRKDTGGGRGTMQLFRRDPSGAETMLTDGSSRNGLPSWSRRGGLLAYDTTRRDGRNGDIYVIDPSVPKSDREIARLEGTWSAADWSPDGSQILAVEAVSSAVERLWRIDVATGQKTLMTPASEPALWLGPRFSPDGRSIYAVSARHGDVQRLWRGDAAGGNWIAVTAEADPIDEYDLSPDGRQAALVVDRGAATELRVIDVATGRSRVTPALPPGVVSGVTWHPGGAEVAFNFAGARTFRDVYSLVVESGLLERWTASEIAGANLETLPDAEIITWKSFDGLEIPGVLYRPSPRFSGPRPVMINVHGGPEMVERPRMLGRSNYFRNELGMAVIYPNIRGSIGYGRRFEQLDNGMRREDAIKDIGALLDWIAAQPGLDRNRVMVTGSSYGGYITLMSAITYGDRLRCAFAGFAMSDLVTFLESTDPSRRQVRIGEYGDPADPKIHDFLKGISPLTRASKLRIPLFIAQGGKDTVVPLSEAEQLVGAVKANDAPLWYVVYEDQGHEQFTRATNDFNIYAWVLFVKQYLLN
ncbi:MAG TPA: prolyl oligopeptidase family serine peptidase [Vicinamibacterales bacterium]|nr:prolyl oligopeptidase family serine peptidase [Vicinamibacterales bacterium]